jgi:hypothetical protein
MRTPILTALALTLVSICIHGATAGAADDSAATLLPTDPAAWLNAPPLTPQMWRAKGRVVFLRSMQATARSGRDVSWRKA